MPDELADVQSIAQMLQPKVQPPGCQHHRGKRRHIDTEDIDFPEFHHLPHRQTPTAAMAKNWPCRSRISWITAAAACACTSSGAASPARAGGRVRNQAKPSRA